MKSIHGRFLAVVLLAGLCLAAGCQMLAPFYVAAIMMGYDQRIEPPFKFPEDAKRIAVITFTDLETQMEMGHMDHELNELLGRKLFEGFGEKEGSPEVITSSRIAKFQDEHPDWQSLDPAEMGQLLKADYVIYLEIRKVSLYEDGPSRILYRGKAEVGLSVTRVENDTVVYSDYVSIQFPTNRPIPVSPDIPPLKFRREFLRRIADRISWYFLPHESGEEFERSPA